MDHNKCRLCNENVGVTSLFDTAESGLQLSAKVMYCAKIEIAQDDGLPAYICSLCEDNLASAYSFIIKCEDTNITLRSLKLLKIDLKQETENESRIKTENFHDDDESLAYDKIFDDSCDSLYKNSKLKLEVAPQVNVKTKRKYVKRSNVKKKSKCQPVKCKVCGRVCNNPSALLAHSRTHTDEKPFSCTSCDKKYKDRGSLKQHMIRNHMNGREKNVICENCGKSFYSKTDCKIHMRTHTGETPYACKECPAQFSQIGSLQRHRLIHTGERSHMCSKCPKTFPTREQLRKHYTVHTNEKKFQCTVCEMFFKYKNSLKKHIVCHLNGNIKNFTCDDCGNQFKAKGNLLAHIKRLHSTKSGFCTQCSTNVSNLEMHMWKHDGVRPIKCKLCSSTFFDLHGLSTHISFRHKSTGKFKCTADDCTMKFPSLPMLKFHVLKHHKSLRPYSCEVCPRSFYRKSDCVRHNNCTHKL